MIFRDAASALFFYRRHLASVSLLDRRSRETFLEAVVTVSIIALLVIFGTSGYQAFLNKATMLEAFMLNQTHRAEISAIYAATGRLPEPGSMRDAVSANAGRYFQGAVWRDDEVVFARADDTGLSPATLSFRIAQNAEGTRLIYLCGSAEPPAGFFASEPENTSLPDARLPFICRS